MSYVVVDEVDAIHLIYEDVHVMVDFLIIG